MNRFLALLFVALMAVPAAAQAPPPAWYVKGEFNGWTTDPNYQMIVDPNDSTHYSRTLGGFFPDTAYEYKVALDDWSQSAPGTNGKIYTDANGEMTLNFWDKQSWNDGWSPSNTRRVGYADPGQFGWEIVGSFNNWPDTAHDPNYTLMSMGNGLYHGSFTFPAGTYQYKFRGLAYAQNDPNTPQNEIWDTSIGTDFGNTGGNNFFTVLANGDTWNFDLDLPDGRFKAAPLINPDHNGDGKVDAADYVMWRKNPNAHGGAAGYSVWKTNFGNGYEWYVRGDFNGYDLSNRMVDQGGGHYTATISGLTPGTNYEYKVARGDWSASYPGSNGKVPADANGEIHYHFYELQGASWADASQGWSPASANRVGYEDPHQFGWEVVGSFDGWPDTGMGNPSFYLTDQGNGLYTGTFPMPAPQGPGTYYFKFRKQSDWAISIGDDFGNAAGDIPFDIAADGQVWNFQLDLPHGRWRVFPNVMATVMAAVPEPCSMVLTIFGLAMLGLTRRMR